MSGIKFSSIRVRLLGAFALVALLTIAAVAVSWNGLTGSRAHPGERWEAVSAPFSLTRSPKWWNW